ncbi:MAG TPA: 2-C-methyl-D-erythritol 4-phosphate cytidylyltransferase [Phycisphaerales bacterium]|nr:2-C-methyl-D-erythritol 4-phosphate cytidylyltransferase [Phycisphaerales bacterium]
MQIAVLIPAAGAGRRYVEAAGAEGPRSKLDEDLGGRPVLHRTIEAFTNYDAPGRTLSPIVVAGPHGEQEFAEFKMRHGDKLSILGVQLVRGGETHRWQTVRAALEAIPGSATHVAIHDAARPCVGTELLDRVFDAAERFRAVVPALDVTDTIKCVAEEPVPDEGADPLAAILGAPKKGPGLRSVEQTLDRARVVAVQTPQVFAADLIRRAYAQSDLTSTDDAGLVERLGERVVVVEGDAANIKITRPLDLKVARALLGLKGPTERATHKRF